MAMPKFRDLFDDVLEVLSNGEVLHRRELRQRVIDQLSLSDSERAETNPGGGNRANSRVHWLDEQINLKMIHPAPESTRSDHFDELRRNVRTLCKQFPLRARAPLA